MKALAAGPQVYDFSFPRKDTILKVEVWEDSVTIRATRDSFSARRKDAFVRELIAEGGPKAVTHRAVSARAQYGNGSTPGDRRQQMEGCP